MRARPLLVALVGLGIVPSCSSLVLEGVSPAVVDHGTSAELVVSGRGFTDELLFSLEAPGLDITLGAPVVESDTEARVRVGASTPVGRYTLLGAQGGQSAALDDALAVVAGGARVVFVDVGQGDATIVIAPDGETLLIDGGRVEDEDTVRAALEEHAGGRLDAVVISHYDVDHAGGVVELLAGADGAPGTDDDLVPTTFHAPSGLAACDAVFCARLGALRATATLPAVGDAIPLGALDVRVVAVDGDVGEGPVAAGLEDNGNSVVVMITWGERRVLVLGDLTGGGLGTVDVEGPLSLATGPVDVLRVAHHGSATSSNAAALMRWQPSLAVVSTGTDNPYCHPDEGVLGRLAAAAGEVRLTGRGIVDDGDRCGGVTPSYDNVRPGLGTIVVTVRADGTIED